LLGGYPLLCYSIAAAKLAGVENVWISTGSQEYAEIAKKFGAETPFIRSPELSSDQSANFGFMQDAMLRQKDNLDDFPEFWVHLRPTNPLRKPKVIRNAIAECLAREDIDSLSSAHEVPKSPFKWFLKDQNNLFRGLHGNVIPEEVSVPRQSFPKAYNPNGHVDIVKASHAVNPRDLHGKNMYVYETHYCSEIDTLEDFEYLDYKLGKENPPIKSHLDSF
jgi:CMP-N,N'-diacetyllegionaminic acid synthase